MLAPGPTTTALPTPMPTAPEGPSRLPLYVALLAIVAAFLRFGYDYGAGDQDELIPSILRLLDPSLFTRDWLIRTVTDGVNVRTYFLWLAALPSLVLPPWLAVALLWVGVMAA